MSSVKCSTKTEDNVNGDDNDNDSNSYHLLLLWTWQSAGHFAYIILFNPDNVSISGNVIIPILQRRTSRLMEVRHSAWHMVAFN